MMLDLELQVALEAARLAARVTEHLRVEMRAAAWTKADRSPVTAADFAAQALINRVLRARFPNDRVVAEEDRGVLENAGLSRSVLEALRHAAGLDIGTEELADLVAWRGPARDEADGADGSSSLEGPDRAWFVDPIDGTEGFCRDLCYAVAIGFCVQGEPVLGVIAAPNLKSDGDGEPERLLFHARKGGGAWQQPLDGGEARPILAGRRADARILVASRSHDDAASGAKLAEALGLREVRHYDSLAKYALVARGDADLYLRWPRRDGQPEKAWDHCAGVVLVEEAGGRVTDLDGRPPRFQRGELAGLRGIAATNGAVHDQVLAAAAAVAPRAQA